MTFRDSIWAFIDHTRKAITVNRDNKTSFNVRP